MLESALDLSAIPRAGAPRVERIGRVSADIDLHALALALACPALIERGDCTRESWHVLPLWPRGFIESGGGRVIIGWPGPGGGVVLREGRGLDALRDVLRVLATPPPAASLAADIPFAGGLVVLLNYSLAHEIEQLPSTTEDRDGLPDLLAHACPGAVLVPRGGGDALLAWLPVEEHGDGPRWGLTEKEALLHLGAARHALKDPHPLDLDDSPHEGRPLSLPHALWERADHEAAVSEVIENLRAGEIYQANVTQRFEAKWEGSALPLHAILRRTNPSPFSGWFRGLGRGWDVVSGSPERLVRLRGRELLTEPIKGTAVLPRGRETPDDEIIALAAGLASSAKDQAEHVMIVDLHRNDLGRVSAPGSVRVEQMMRLDRRSHVVQAVADIRSTLRDGADAVDVIEAMFPAGSVTGVPKIRAMEILDTLERWSRGPYCGSFGFISSWGDLDLNVLIRSAWRVGDRLAFAAGGGIVLDSDPGKEYDESLGKASALRAAIEELLTP